MDAAAEQAFRMRKLIEMNHELDWLIEETTNEKQLGALGALLFIRALKIIRSIHGDKNTPDIIRKMTDEQFSTVAESPRGWDSDYSRWDISAFLSDSSGKEIRG